jgi:hypothetical protein
LTQKEYLGKNGGSRRRRGTRENDFAVAKRHQLENFFYLGRMTKILSHDYFHCQKINFIDPALI